MPTNANSKLRTSLRAWGRRTTNRPTPTAAARRSTRPPFTSVPPPAAVGFSPPRPTWRARPGTARRARDRERRWRSRRRGSEGGPRGKPAVSPVKRAEGERPSYVPHDDAAEQPGRAQDEDAEEHGERHRQLQLGAEEPRGVPGQQADPDADQERADDRAERAVDPAEHGGG